MTKLRVLLVSSLLTVTAGIATAGSIRVDNGDSKTHTIELKCNGSKKVVEIKGSTTTTYTFHSTATSCEITGGSIAFPTKTLENGQKWAIRSGKAKAY